MLPIMLEPLVKHTDEPFLVVGAEGGINALFAGEFDDFCVNERAVRLHKVIRQAEGIFTPVIMNSERRMEAGSDQGPTDGGSQYGVSVVQQTILIGRRSPTEELGVIEQEGPVTLRGLRLNIHGVSGTDRGGEGEQAEV
jgi:hypothetical protein